MGRPATKSTISQASGCWRVEETNAEVVMRCPGNTTVRLPRRAIKTPMEMFQSGMARRQRCSDQCDAPPSFRGPNGAQSMPVPEVGYGSPFRWEMARMIAGEWGLITLHSFVAELLSRVDAVTSHNVVGLPIIVRELLSVARDLCLQVVPHLRLA